MEIFSHLLLILCAIGGAASVVALAAVLVSDEAWARWKNARKSSRAIFAAAVVLAALYGGTKQAGSRVSYPRTDSGTDYLTDAGSSVTNDAVILNFTRAALVPDEAWLYLDACPLSVTNSADVAANCVTVYSNQFSAIALPLTVPYADATNYNWYAYTDWTPGPVVHTNGVVNVAWLKAKGEMPPNALRVVPLRTAVDVVNAETPEERAYRLYAPDLAFEIDLSLIATNEMTVKTSYVGKPWSGTAFIDWGDGTVETNLYVGYWDCPRTHVYPDMGKYVIRMSPVPYPLYNVSAAKKAAVTRVLRFGDADQNPSTSSAKSVSQFGDCKNLRAFEDGTLARWPEGYGEIDATYAGCTSLDATVLPEWPEGVTTIGATYSGCSSLALTRIPEWPESLVRITGEYWKACYANCTGITTTKFPEWPKGLKYIINNRSDGEITSVYQGCKGITATSFPEWPEGLLYADCVYRGCTGVKTATIPEWPSNLVSAAGTYAGCTGITATRIPEWPKGLTRTHSGEFSLFEYSGTYGGCTGLTGEMPAWPDAVQNATRTYSGCSGLTGEIPAWGAAITSADYTYYNCKGLTGAWTDDAALLMPTNITSHGYTVLGAGASLRALFYSDWGGTRTKPADE